MGNMLIIGGDRKVRFIDLEKRICLTELRYKGQMLNLKPCLKMDEVFIYTERARFYRV